MDMITLKPVEMTETVMQDLEDRELIIRLVPGRHMQSVSAGESRGTPVYQSDSRYGGHMLLAVTIGRTAFSAFGAHPDNEEFLLIGDANANPLYLVISLHRKEELDRRIQQKCLTADDFVCLRVKYNDPAVSFFTMLAGVPHGEAITDAGREPATFYVTEPCDMGIELTAFGDYQLIVAIA